MPHLQRNVPAGTPNLDPPNVGEATTPHIDAATTPNAATAPHVDEAITHVDEATTPNVAAATTHVGEATIRIGRATIHVGEATTPTTPHVDAATTPNAATTPHVDGAITHVDEATTPNVAVATTPDMDAATTHIGEATIHIYETTTRVDEATTPHVGEATIHVGIATIHVDEATIQHIDGTTTHVREATIHAVEATIHHVNDDGPRSTTPSDDNSSVEIDKPKPHRPKTDTRPVVNPNSRYTPRVGKHGPRSDIINISTGDSNVYIVGRKIRNPSTFNPWRTHFHFAIKVAKSNNEIGRHYQMYVSPDKRLFLDLRPIVEERDYNGEYYDLWVGRTSMKHKDIVKLGKCTIVYFLTHTNHVLQLQQSSYSSVRWAKRKLR